MVNEVMSLRRGHRWFTGSNLFPAALAALLLATIFFPDVKASLMGGLMKLGFFRPDFTTERLKGTFDYGEELRLTDTAGKTISLSAFRGKVVLLNFWATWCPPCRAELPSLQKLAARWKGKPDVVILTVDVDGRLPASRRFLDRRHLALPLYAAAGAVPSALLGSAVPTTDVFDKQGALVVRHEGVVNFDAPAMDRFLEDLQ